MSILVSHIQTGLGLTKQDILEAGRKAAGLRREEVASAYLVKTSVDARRQDRIHLVSSVSLEVRGDEEELLRRLPPSKRKNVQIQRRQQLSFPVGDTPLEHPPVIIGFGPAGMFAGLALARMGYRPLILERGREVEVRVEQVQRFWQHRQLDPGTNVQFGEGGAGTFSDGKLTTRINDPRCGYIIEELVRHGAPEEIRYKQKPHVGTDRLRGVVKSIRQEILRLGGQVEFGVQATGLSLNGGRVCGVLTNRGELPARVVIAAMGHSARDTFEALMGQGVFFEPKPFSVGVRIEQRQEVIDRGLYGEYAEHPALPRGEYQLSHRENGRGVYTFCMCPGGFVVPSSSEPGTVVTNGMSEYARSGENANAALVVSVDSRDYGPHPRDGIAFQRCLERRAFVAGGGDYRAPAQSARSFLLGSAPDLSRCRVTPTFACGVRETRLEGLFPPYVNRMLREGLERFQRKLPGFADGHAVLTGVETRTSSPVRMTRGEESLQALGWEGLYPCGEGAGYAGGIVSAAVDGVRVAQRIMEQFRPLAR